MRLRLPVLLALGLLALPATAFAQAQGSFPAVIVCDGLGGGGRERATFTVDLGPDGRAEYRLKLAGAPGETGSGRLAGRTLALAGKAGGAYGSRYTGEITGRGGVLTGTHTMAKGGTRACQVRLGDG